MIHINTRTHENYIKTINANLIYMLKVYAQNKKNQFICSCLNIYMKIYIYLNEGMKRRPMGIRILLICSSVTENNDHELWQQPREAFW